MYTYSDSHLKLELDCTSCGAMNVMVILEKWAKRGAPRRTCEMPCHYCEDGTVIWEPVDYTLLYRRKAIKRLEDRKQSMKEDIRRYESANITSELDDLMYEIRRKSLQQLEDIREEVLEAYIKEFRDEDEFRWNQNNLSSLYMQ